MLTHAPAAPLPILLVSAVLSLGLPLMAAAAAREASPLMVWGVLAHDQGPASDHHEHGIDLNGEVLFTPLNLIGTPRPHVGAILNFSGYTSTAYAGLTFPLHDSRRWFGNGFIGGAIHNGPLHKDPVACQVGSDCGFGARVLPRLGLEWGYYVTTENAISLFWDHMSHGDILSSENEGIDHLGIRYRQPF